MTRLADPDYTDGAPSLGRVAQFSRDGKEFVIVVRRGNLEDNTNEYRLLFWKTKEIGNARVPEELLRMSSSSNRCAIENVKWLEDNETLAFLGERPGELHQLFTFNIHTHTLTGLTKHPTNLLSYGITPDGKRLAFTAEAARPTLFEEKAQREGIIVGAQPLADLIEGKGSAVPAEVWFQREVGISRQLTVPDSSSYSGEPVLSPDGRFIAIRAQVQSIPEEWKEYADPLLQGYTSPKIIQGQPTWLSRYALIDTRTGQSRFLLNSPVRSVDSLIAWLPGGGSVAIAGVYLPLDSTEGTERTTRMSKTFAVEVNVSNGNVTTIAQEELITPGFTHDYERSLAWDSTADSLLFGFSSVYPAPDLQPRVAFHKSGGRWQKVASVSSTLDTVEVVLEEDMNNPPRIFAVDRAARRKMMLLDLNPQFKLLRFGKVDQIEWSASDGHHVKGGLYYPVDYKAGRRYPLVIQTHLWTPDRFWIDGPWTTAFAAQPLAGKGIMVLQADESGEDLGKLEEIKREVSSLEGAIDYLDSKGLIDRSRVGIVGFSRTCLFVKYALTHSRRHFVAASVTDGVDDGYFQYLIFANVSPVLLEYSEWANGGPPFGGGLKSWRERASGFNLDKVSTPVRILARNPNSLLCEWEWFAGLTRLHKPVELVYLQNGAHILQRPWERMVSQQGNVDWFAFWLKGEEDHDLSKAAEYARWREMRTR
jgi:dipeptidyl aminopeptidase/acylaminoacyl peptidase